MVALQVIYSLKELGSSILLGELDVEDSYSRHPLVTAIYAAETAVLALPVIRLQSGMRPLGITFASEPTPQLAPTSLTEC